MELLTIHDTADISSNNTALPVAAVLKCENEIDDNPAATKCLDCDFYLCEDCTAIHKQHRATKNHRIPTLAELKEGGAKQLEQKRYCSAHEGEELKLYCITCQEVICRDCTIVKHKKHDYTFINDIREELTKEMESLMVSVGGKEAKCQGLQDSIPLAREKEKQKLATEEASINMFFDKHVEDLQLRIAALQDHRATLLTSLTEVSAVHRKQLLADEDSLQLSHTLLTSARTFAQQQLSSASSTDLVMMSKQVIQRMETLRKHKLKTIKASLWGVSFSEDNPTSSKIQSLSADDIANAVCQIKSPLLGKNTFQIVNGVSKNFKLEPVVTVTLSSRGSCPVKIEPSGDNWTVTYFITYYPQPCEGAYNMDEDSSDDEKKVVYVFQPAVPAFPAVKVSVKINGVRPKNGSVKLQLMKEMAAGTRVELHDSSRQGTIVAFQSHTYGHSTRQRRSLPPNHASVQWDDGNNQQMEIDLLKVLLV